MLEETLNELKRKSNKVYSKDALTVAVDHYLGCKESLMRAALEAAKVYIIVQTSEDSTQKEEEKAALLKNEIVKKIEKALEE